MLFQDSKEIDPSWIPINFTPKEILTVTSELHRLRHPRQVPVLYVMVVLSLIVCIVLLPLLYIDVSIKSPGILRATTDVTTLKSTSVGIVKAIMVNENAYVKEGQLLIDIKSPVLTERIRYLQNKVAEANSYRNDVLQLLQRESFETKPMRGSVLARSPATPLYRQYLEDYHKKIGERQTRFLKVKQDYDRNKMFYDQRTSRI